MRLMRKMILFLSFLAISIASVPLWAQGRLGVAAPRGPGFGGAPVGPGFGGTAVGPGFGGAPVGPGFDGRARGPGFSPGPNPIGFQGVPDDFRGYDDPGPVVQQPPFGSGF